MMKEVVFFFILLLSLPARAQNLLPNPGFEQYSECPNDVSQASRCNSWGEYIHGSPDYYNCSFYTFPNFIDTLGFAAEGTGLMGFIGGDNAQIAGNTLTEQITGMLNKQIKAGKTYRLQFDLRIAQALPYEQFPMENKVDFGFHFYNQGDVLTYNIFNPSVPFLTCNVFAPTVAFPMSQLKEYNKYQHFDTCFVARTNSDKVLIGTFCNATTSSYPYSFYYFNVDNLKLEEVNTDPQISIKSTLGCVNASIDIDHNINQENGLVTWYAPGSSIPFANSIPKQVFYSEPGIYTINANYYQGCKTFHYVEMITVNEPIIFSINDTTLCPDGTINFEMEYLNAAHYLWDDGSNLSARSVKQKGKYWLQVENGCRTSDTFQLQQLNNCIQDLFIPNSFTPNNDGLNDVFKVYASYPVTNFELKIFNRWGQLVFTTNNTAQGWDGANYDVGNYFFLVNYTNNQGVENTQKGSLHLIR